MANVNVCPHCGVPLYISSQHRWLDNGVIQPAREESQRLVFFECGNLDPLFKGIGELIGMPVERMVIDASRRSTKHYMDRVIPDDVKEMIRAGDMDLDLVFDSTFIIWRVMGYGRLALDEVRYRREKDDYIRVLAERPYSVPLAVGNFAGSIEAIIGKEPGIEFEETTPGVFGIKIFEAENPPELRQRLRWRDYEKPLKPGDIDFERCPGCGVPAALSSYKWDQANGSIRSTMTGRRMVMTGPSMIDPIFDELEGELGDTIPRVVVEAQKRFVESGFFAVEEVASEENMRLQLALRGLGNLRELKMGRSGVSLRLENSTLHLLGVGLAQGLFEKAFGVESEVEWELHDDGDLEVQVSPGKG
ncbi:MAG: hypothetical protein H5T74_08435 [Actinobacteria bacterium]|nr:hypothetical protein [Actinomycetota bacterium]